MIQFRFYFILDGLDFAIMPIGIALLCVGNRRQCTHLSQSSLHTDRQISFLDNDTRRSMQLRLCHRAPPFYLISCMLGCARSTSTRSMCAGLASRCLWTLTPRKTLASLSFPNTVSLYYDIHSSLLSAQITPSWLKRQKGSRRVSGVSKTTIH